VFCTNYNVSKYLFLRSRPKCTRMTAIATKIDSVYDFWSVRNHHYLGRPGRYSALPNPIGLRQFVFGSRRGLLIPLPLRCAIALNHKSKCFFNQDPDPSLGAVHVEDWNSSAPIPIGFLWICSALILIQLRSRY
jgi:hypothetical protein